MVDMVGKYSSITSFVQASRTLKYSINEDVHSYWERERSSGWYGLEDDCNLDDVVNIVENGWTDGANRLARISDQIASPMVASVRRRRIWDGHGDEINMDRVYSGNLDKAWRRTTKSPSRVIPRVKIVVDAIASGGTNSEHMFWKGAAAVVLADTLISSGYAVELVSAFEGVACSDKCGKVNLECIVKPYNAPFSLVDAAASCALPAFFRAIGHAWYGGHCPDELYSSGMIVKKLERSKLDKGEASYLFLAHQDIKDESAAREWVAACTKELQPEYAEG